MVAAEFCYYAPPPPAKLLRNPEEAVPPRPFLLEASMTDFENPLLCEGDEKA